MVLRMLANGPEAVEAVDGIDAMEARSSAVLCCLPYQAEPCFAVDGPVGSMVGVPARGAPAFSCAPKLS